MACDAKTMTKYRDLDKPWEVFIGSGNTETCALLDPELKVRRLQTCCAGGYAIQLLAFCLILSPECRMSLPAAKIGRYSSVSTTGLCPGDAKVPKPGAFGFDTVHHWSIGAQNWEDLIFGSSQGPGFVQGG